MGKSRIAAELALEVHADGGQVRLGSCLEELGIPYEPFVQILDADAASLTETALAERVGSGGPVLARLAPNVASRLGLAAPGSEAEGPVERAEIFATLRDYLERSARQAPLLVVIEDVHWSTATTRDSLRYLARLGGATPALLVLTSRDSAPDLDDALAGFLAELGRQPCVEVISLSALTEEDVAGLLAVTGRGRPAEEVYAATGGNPLLALEAGGGDRRVNSVSSLLSARFDRLASAEMELLDVAVVIGSEFHADLVAAAAGRDLGSVLEALESAEDAGLITADPREPLRFSFVHALFRTVRYDSMRTSTRLRLHAADRRRLATAGGRRTRAAAPRPPCLRRRAPRSCRGCGDVGEARRPPGSTPSWLRRSRRAVRTSARHAGTGPICRIPSRSSPPRRPRHRALRWWPPGRPAALAGRDRGGSPASRRRSARQRHDRIVRDHREVRRSVGESTMTSPRCSARRWTAFRPSRADSGRGCWSD